MMNMQHIFWKHNEWKNVAEYPLDRCTLAKFMSTH